jgi:hypothetical protein
VSEKLVRISDVEREASKVFPCQCEVGGGLTRACLHEYTCPAANGISEVLQQLRSLPAIATMPTDEIRAKCDAIDRFASKIEHLDETGGDSTDSLYALLAVATALANRVRAFALKPASEPTP